MCGADSVRLSPESTHPGGPWRCGHSPCVWWLIVSFPLGGGILVIESVVDEDRQGPLTTLLFSLNMLLQTEGQERTLSQYHALVSSAGFKDFQFKKTGGIYDAILAWK